MGDIAGGHLMTEFIVNSLGFLLVLRYLSDKAGVVFMNENIELVKDSIRCVKEYCALWLCMSAIHHAGHSTSEVIAMQNGHGNNDRLVSLLTLSHTTIFFNDFRKSLHVYPLHTGL